MSGTKTGPNEILAYFGQLGEKGTTTEPSQFMGDGDTVAVLTTVTIAGESTVAADIFTVADGKVARSEGFGTEALLRRTFT